MSRSAIDATRFTATSPHAYSKTFLRSAPSSASTTPRTNTPPNRFNQPNAARKLTPGSNNIPPPETPAEKVARLRAARLAEKQAQISKWDKIVLRGRVWADRAHKVTAYSLIGFSVVAAGITAFALTDMILHNRRKRSAFYAEQHSLYATRLLDAIETEKAGLPLDEDQILIMNRERARVQAEEAKKERSWGKSIKVFLLGGLKQEEEEEVPEVVPSEAQVLESMGVDQTSILEAAKGKRPIDGKNTERRDGSGILQAVEGKRRKGEKVMEARGVEGGPLDQVAQEAVDEASSKGGWINRGRGG
ncbi:hypothetical protein N7G274_000781 [Stereocaulon virgatum]|uniref:Cytochrome oxidase c assembly-domain-containing protein n=1 Tax=Stereocaulon virgatum TaxID=373712 RepID=A0ABR4AQF3_9LECA